MRSDGWRTVASLTAVNCPLPRLLLNADEQDGELTCCPQSQAFGKFRTAVSSATRRGQEQLGTTTLQPSTAEEVF